MNETAEPTGEAVEPSEAIVMNEAVYYFDQLLMLLSFLHSLVSLSLLVAYYCLKVSVFGAVV
jgi:hypothetical protein